MNQRNILLALATFFLNSFSYAMEIEMAKRTEVSEVWGNATRVPLIETLFKKVPGKLAFRTDCTSTLSATRYCSAYENGKITVSTLPDGIRFLMGSKGNLGYVTAGNALMLYDLRVAAKPKKITVVSFQKVIRSIAIKDDQLIATTKDSGDSPESIEKITIQNDIHKIIYPIISYELNGESYICVPMKTGGYTLSNSAGGTEFKSSMFSKNPLVCYNNTLIGIDAERRIVQFDGTHVSYSLPISGIPETLKKGCIFAMINGKPTLYNTDCAITFSKPDTTVDDAKAYATALELYREKKFLQDAQELAVHNAYILIDRVGYIKGYLPSFPIEQHKPTDEPSLMLYFLRTINDLKTEAKIDFVPESPLERALIQQFHFLYGPTFESLKRIRPEATVTLHEIQTHKKSIAESTQQLVTEKDLLRRYIWRGCCATGCLSLLAGSLWYWKNKVFESAALTSSIAAGIGYSIIHMLKKQHIEKIDGLTTAIKKSALAETAAWKKIDALGGVFVCQQAANLPLHAKYFSTLNLSLD